MFTTRNNPEVSVSARDTAPVLWFVSWTSAVPTEAPAGSTTVPRTELVTVWAHSAVALTSANRATARFVRDVICLGLPSTDSDSSTTGWRRIGRILYQL